MALTVSIALGFPFSSGAPVVVNQTVQMNATVTNTGASAVQLTALNVYETTESDANIAQPNFQTPTTSIGSPGFPTLAPAGSVTVPFQVVFASPIQPGASPQNVGGASPDQRAATADALFALQAQAQSSDGSVATSPMFTVPVLSAVAPFPVPTGGAAQFGPGTGADSALIAVIL
jgi:hypothetical protein